MPERCVEAYYLQRTRFERIAERKLRQRQFTEDGNVEISGRDLRYVPGEDRTDTRGSVSNRGPKQSLVAGDRNGEKCPQSGHCAS